MLLLDYILIAAILVAVFAWWRRGLGNRTRIIVIASVVAIVAGLIAALDDRWQSWVGVIVGLAILLSAWVSGRRDKEARTVTAIISGGLVTLLGAFSILMLYWFPIPDLPAPSGEYAVGVQDFELTDENRKGVMVAGPDEGRRLLVRVWYPADNVDGLTPRPYFTDLEADTTARGLGSASMAGADFAFTYIKHSATNSYEGAPLLADANELPVVIYSHGYTSFLNQNTALMEELASNGYLVFSVQHTYDSSPTVFPNGDVAPSDPNLVDEMMADLTGDAMEEMAKAFTSPEIGIRFEATRKNLEDSLARNSRLAARSARIWVDDRVFVHDMLEQGRVPDSVAEIVASGDFTSTAQIGMSFGGSTTGGVCMIDPRCAAGVNLDGGDYHGTPLNANVPVPFLMLYSDVDQMASMLSEGEITEGHGFNDFSYERLETAGLRGDVYRFIMKETKHLGVSDFTLFFRNPVRAMLLGSIDSSAAIQIQNDFVLGFFDTYVRGVDVGFPDAQLAAHASWVEVDDISDIREWWLSNNPMDRMERVIIETTLGDIEVGLYTERAPTAARNFLDYVDGGHYAGAGFYRAVRPGDGGPFGIVQGGLMAAAITDPDAAAGMASPFPPITHERTDETGITNDIGTISYARGEPGTAASEFFINLTDNYMLDSGDTSRNPDGQGYTAFGRVLRGFDVLREIQQQPTDAPVEFEVVKGQIMSDPVMITRMYRPE